MIYHMISDAWSCLDLLFRHWGSWWFTIVNMYRKDWPGGGKAGGLFHILSQNVVDVQQRSLQKERDKFAEIAWGAVSLSLPLSTSSPLFLSLSIYLCVFQKSTARFPAQYNRAVFCCSESFGVNGTLPFSLVCLFDKDDKCWDEGNAGMWMRHNCWGTQSFWPQLIWIAFLVDEVLIHHIRIGNCTQFTKTSNSSDRPLCSAPAVFGLIAFQRLAFSQRTLTWWSSCLFCCCHCALHSLIGVNGFPWPRSSMCQTAAAM